MAFIPLALQLLPLVPALINGVDQIIRTIRADPATPADTKAQLDALSAKLAAAVEHVANAPEPKDS